MSTLVFDVEGMTCEGCVGTARGLLRRVRGVARVEITLVPPRAVVEGEGVDVEGLRRAAAVRGYRLVEAAGAGGGGRGAEDGGRGAEDGGPKTEDGGPKAEDGGPRAEDGGPRAEDGGPKAEDGGPKAEDASALAPRPGERAVVYDLEGLTCGSCVAAVERAIRGGVPRATDVAVSLPLRTARVRLPEDVPVDAVAAAVRAAGYGATPRAEAAGPEVAAEAGGVADRRRLAEVADARWRALAAVALGAPLVVLGMSEMLGGAPLVAGSGPLQGVLATAVLLVAAPLLRRGLGAAARGAPTMDSLVALGTLTAWGASAVALAAGAAGAGHAGHAGHTAGSATAGHLHFEAAGLIAALVLVGRFLEARAQGRAGDALRRLLDLRPATALLLDDAGAAREVEAATVRPGDRVRVLPGARVPVDGRVLEGTSAVTEAVLTGEALPVRRGPGARVAAGTTNGEGALVVLAERTGADTEVARIAALVGAAQGTKAPIERLADAVAGRLVPVVVAAAALAALGWWLAGAGVGAALSAAVAVLVVACPCALGLATPVAIVVAVGRAATERVLVRDAASLEALATATHVLLDKTGTLTAGRPTVVEQVGPDAARALRLAASVEAGSEHPLARAVVAAAVAAGGGAPRPARGVKATPGAGVEGDVAPPGTPPAALAAAPRTRVLVGAPDWLVTRGAAATDLAPLVAAAAARAATPVGVAEVEGAPGGAPGAAAEGAAGAAEGARLRVVGGLLLADPPRPGAAEAVAALRALGLAPVLVTGDAAAPAAALARAVGIDDVRAGVRPAGKLEVVAALEAAGARVAALGDGVNDAPALARATVGVAMGGGTDAAREAAAVTLLDDDPRRLALAVRLARRTRATIRANLAWAFGYNVVAIPLAALGLLPPALAAAAMAASSLLVVGNGLRLRAARLDP